MLAVMGHQDLSKFLLPALKMVFEILYDWRSTLSVLGELVLFCLLSMVLVFISKNFGKDIEEKGFRVKNLPRNFKLDFED